MTVPPNDRSARLPATENDLQPLSEEECWSLLDGNQLGRLAIVSMTFLLRPF